MDFKLTEINMDDIQRISTSRVGFYLNRVRNSKFNVGDILIKKIIEFDYDEEYIVTYPNSTVNVRYVVVHADEDRGIYFYKEIDENGKMTSAVNVINDPDDQGYDEASVFEVDPTFLDAVIMGQDFDLSHLYKEERERKDHIITMNKKISFRPTSLKELNNFLKNLRPGDNIFYHHKRKYGFNDNEWKEFKFQGFRKMQWKYVKKTRRGEKATSLCLKKDFYNDKHVLYMRCGNDARLMTSLDFLDKALYMARPIDLRPNI